MGHMTNELHELLEIWEEKISQREKAIEAYRATMRSPTDRQLGRLQSALSEARYRVQQIRTAAGEVV